MMRHKGLDSPQRSTDTAPMALLAESDGPKQNNKSF
uniref:Uncharacterized protein n=1 Tax=Anguilla anguilla TaxID=7936 RepID=A0A0E9UTC8_ANGAN